MVAPRFSGVGQAGFAYLSVCGILIGLGAGMVCLLVVAILVGWLAGGLAGWYGNRYDMFAVYS